MNLEELKSMAGDIRVDIVKMGGRKREAGIRVVSLSAAGIYVCVVFRGRAQARCGKPKAEDRDRFLLSKAMRHRRFTPRLPRLATSRKKSSPRCASYSRLQGHPDCRKLPGVEASTGLARPGPLSLPAWRSA